MTSRQNYMDALTEAITAAGQAIEKIAEDGFETIQKANQDPVTAADLAADDILKTALLERFPETGWLSEETRDDKTRLDKDLIWVVDPVDGTREFTMRLPEYAISVALVEKGQPIVAAVLNPAADELFTAMAGQGAELNGQAISSARPLPEKPVVLASRSEIKRGEWAPFEDACEIQTMGSIAYKLAVVAAGRVDATFSLGPKHEWDIAAGCLLVAEAGGQTSDKQWQPFTFNKPQTHVSSIVAAGADAWRWTREIITERGHLVPEREVY